MLFWIGKFDLYRSESSILQLKGAGPCLVVKKNRLKTRIEEDNEERQFSSPVIFMGMPWKPPTGSFGLTLSGSTFCTFTNTGLRPLWIAHREGEQICVINFLNFVVTLLVQGAPGA